MILYKCFIYIFKSLPELRSIHTALAFEYRGKCEDWSSGYLFVESNPGLGTFNLNSQKLRHTVQCLCPI